MKPKRFIIGGFFLLYLLLGFFIYKDYGISNDEQISRSNGIMAYRFVTGKSRELFTYRDRNYGTAIELPLVAIEDFLKIKDKREIYLHRHLMNFLLFFAGAIFFYKLCLFYFKNWPYALTATFFLIASPRIFAHSFFNSKDIGFLVACIFSAWTFVKFLKKPSIKTAFLHAASSAFAVDVRIIGLLFPVLTIGLLTLLNLKNLFAKTKRLGFAYLFFYCLCFIALTIAFWPYLWLNPIGHITDAVRQMSYFTLGPYTLRYLGKSIPVENVPWHYLPVWITISTPFAYIFLALIGMAAIAIKFIKKKETSKDFFILSFYFLCWFFLPILAVIMLDSIVYDDWRQLYFIYPALIIISVSGLKSTIKWAFSPFIVVFIALFIVLLIDLSFMIRNHPYQNLFFNVLVGGMKKAKSNFEVDYWATTFRQALEYITKNDKSEKIPIFLAYAHRVVKDILPEADRTRIEFVDNPLKAKYIISNYRYQKTEYPQTEDFYSLIIDGAKVMSVFKVY